MVIFDKQKRYSKEEIREGGYYQYEDGRLTYLVGIEPSDSSKLEPGDFTKTITISHNKNYSCNTGSLNLKDLKALRKVIRQAIRNYESNESFQI